MKCKHCGSEDSVKDGKNPSGSEKYFCKTCQRNFTPQPNRNGYSADTQQAAVQMYVDGVNYRRIGRILGVAHGSVVNWVREAAEQLQPHDTPKPVLDEADVVELDELFTFVGDKKTKSTSSRTSTGTRAAS